MTSRRQTHCLTLGYWYCSRFIRRELWQWLAGGRLIVTTLLKFVQLRKQPRLASAAYIKVHTVSGQTAQGKMILDCQLHNCFQLYMWRRHLTRVHIFMGPKTMLALLSVVSDTAEIGGQLLRKIKQINIINYLLDWNCITIIFVWLSVR
jgi:hypothetical protein